MLTSLDHLVIAVRDLDASSVRYAKLLGRQASWRGSHAAYGTANTLFRLEDTYVELLSPVAKRPLADVLSAKLDERGEGLVALAFGTGDAAAAAGELRARGIAAPDPDDGAGREATSGVERRWRNVFLPESDTRGVMLFVIEHRSAPELLPVAAPLESAAAAIAGVDHVVVRTSDPDAASTLYGKKLGIRLALDKSFPDWGMRLLFFRIGGITVEIAASLAESAASEEDRLWGISYRTPDIEAARERLVHGGFEVSEVRRGRRPGSRVATVHGDPCGVATLLIEHEPR